MYKSLSVVFSTREKNIDYINHIKLTSGINNIEILCYENKNEYSLTEIYNKGLKESHNDIVVFCHDDLIFETKSWGHKILKHFNNPNNKYGILGLAGTNYIGKDVTWWSKSENMIGIVNHYDSEKKSKYETKYSNSFGNEIKPVSVVDGLFFVVDKKQIHKSFDEDIKGFHMYEIDFCLSNKDVNIGVMFNVLVTHLSIGRTNQEWETNREYVANKHKDTLPLVTDIEIEINKTKNINLKLQPKIAVVVMTKEFIPTMIENLYGLIKENDGYNNIKLYICDNSSDESKHQEINDFLKRVKDLYSIDSFVKKYDMFSPSIIKNDMVKEHVDKDTELLLFMDDDIIIKNNVIYRSVQLFEKHKNIGTLGIRLHDVHSAVIHDSLIPLLYNGNNLAIISNNNKRMLSYYNGVRNDVFGNTGSFMFVKKNVFDKLGGFNENFYSCLEDIEFNIRCIVNGYKNIYNGECVGIHLEGLTRYSGENAEETNALINSQFQELLLPIINDNRAILAKYIKMLDSKNINEN